LDIAVTKDVPFQVLSDFVLCTKLGPPPGAH